MALSLFLKKLVNRYWNIAGYLVQLRIEPPAFRAAERKVSELIDDERAEEALALIQSLPPDWQNDPNFISLALFAQFGRED